MLDTHHLTNARLQEAIISMRRALELLDSLDMRLEAALVSQALETMTGAIPHDPPGGAD